MFSYFEKGIKNIYPSKNIDLPELVKLIKNNPCQSQIETIRSLKRNGDLYYKELKRKLPYITPNCIVKCRNLKTDDDFEKNFLLSSRHLYFDIDNIPNVKEVKKAFIEKYKDQVSMVCISSGGDGLSILVKVTNVINTKEQSIQIWEEIRNTILKDENIDKGVFDIGRAMFISYDPDLYYNYDTEITVFTSNTTPKIKDKKGVRQPISDRRNNNRLNETKFNIYAPSIVLRTVCLKTRVDNKNPILDLVPVDYAEVNFPRVIRDGSKHQIYTGMIHSLVYLNPDLDVDYLFSYMNFINNSFADPPMESFKLVRLFKFVYSSIKDSDEYYFRNIKSKNIHFNSRSCLSGNEKRDIASKLNGQIRRNGSIGKILVAKEYLESAGQKITQKSIAKISGLSISTVKRYYNEEPIDIKEAIESINDISPSKTNKIGYSDKFSQFDIQTPFDEYIHPGCPEWVLTYKASCYMPTGMK